jgi:glycosyltransferase involved in cell wall biosynthesis
MFEVSLILIQLFLIILTIIIIKGLNHPDPITALELKSFPKVSIIIPTRNEEKNIENCLESLKNLDYPDFEILVVDNSTDTTKEIAKKYATVIEEPKRPDNWIGKSWACHIGQQNATGEVYLFTDADTVHTPNSLKYMVSVLLSSDGFVTLQTKQILRSFLEKTLLITFFIGVISLGGLRQNKNYAFANGQYMMFTKELYHKIKGHEIIKSSIVEDFAFGILLAKKGINVMLVEKPELVSARMYRSGLDLMNGLTKNLASGASSIGFSGFIRASVVLTAVGVLPNLIFLPFLLPELFSYTTLIIGILSYLYFVLVLIKVEKTATDSFSYAPFLFPVYFTFYQIIVAKSFFSTKVIRKVSWKGINYPV